MNPVILEVPVFSKSQGLGLRGFGFLEIAIAKGVGRACFDRTFLNEPF